MTNILFYHSTGRRKNAIAQVFIKPGTGVITINNKLVNDYFTYSLDQKQIKMPILLTNSLQKFDCNIKVKGGGRMGQIGAIQLGIARAICSIDKSKRVLLKQYGLLSRDARIKERRKYGLKKARKGSQYSKR